MSPEIAATRVEHAKKHLQLQLQSIKDPFIGIGLISMGAAEDLVRTIGIMIDAKIDERIARADKARADG